MRPKKHSPFALYKKKISAGLVWYTKFWDYTARRFAETRSTGIIAGGKRGRRKEAEEAAREMLPSIRFQGDAGNTVFVEYVKQFWAEGSPYIVHADKVDKKPISKNYIKNNYNSAVQHIEPFPGFRGLTLRGLSVGHIKAWQLWMAGRNLSGRRINAVTQTMRVAVRYAVECEDLPRDPFRRIGKAAHTPKERGILTPAEVKRIIASPLPEDLRPRLAVLLGVLCGMRRGEVRGLKWGDIEDGIIHIRHNFIDSEGLKAPKCGSLRSVPVPGTIEAALDALRKFAGKPGRGDYVLDSLTRHGHPVAKHFFEDEFIKILEGIGIPGPWRTQKDKDGKEIKKPDDYVDEQKRRNLTFHSLRHTFITLSRLAGITDIEIQALAGHKSGAMMERYSHAGQVIDLAAAKKKLEAAIG